MGVDKTCAALIVEFNLSPFCRLDYCIRIT
jgi:hypothetical protein